MAGGAGVAAADAGREGGTAPLVGAVLDAQLVASDRGVARIAPTQRDLTVTHRGAQVPRRRGHRQRRCAQRR